MFWRTYAIWIQQIWSRTSTDDQFTSLWFYVQLLIDIDRVQSGLLCLCLVLIQPTEIYHKHIVLIHYYHGHVPGAQFCYGKTYGNDTRDTKWWLRGDFSTWRVGWSEQYLHRLYKLKAYRYQIEINNMWRNKLTCKNNTIKERKCSGIYHRNELPVTATLNKVVI